MLSFLSNAKKAIVAAIGVALTALTFAHSLNFILPASAEAVVGTLIAVLTPVATWLTPGPTTTPATTPPAAS